MQATSAPGPKARVPVAANPSFPKMQPPGPLEQQVPFLQPQPRVGGVLAQVPVPLWPRPARWQRALWGLLGGRLCPNLLLTYSGEVEGADRLSQPSRENTSSVSLLVRAGLTGKSLGPSTGKANEQNSSCSSRTLRPLTWLQDPHRNRAESSGVTSAGGPPEPEPQSWNGRAWGQQVKPCVSLVRKLCACSSVTQITHMCTRIHMHVSAVWAGHSVCSHPQEATGTKDKLEVTDSPNVTSKSLAEALPLLPAS